MIKCGSMHSRDRLKLRLWMQLASLGFYPVLDLGFGGGGGTEALGNNVLGADVLRVARKTTTANMIAQTTTATIRENKDMANG